MSVFARFAPRLRDAIVMRLGWSSLREVQELAGQALLDGKNAVVLAPTAGGKTEAAMFPALSQLVEEPVALGRVGILYLAPIRALLNNQAERLGLYTEMVGLERTVWHGDTTETERKRFLREPTELLMTTPESLEVMLISRRVDTAGLFADLRMVVVDEVHAMAGTDRGSHLASILERIARLSKRDVQRVGLSATVGNPEEVLGWLNGTSQRPQAVIDPPRPKVRREVKLELCEEMDDLVSTADGLARGQKSFVFCESRATAERVAEQMAGRGAAVFVHHSAVAREERQRAEAKFHAQDAAGACIVCTSTLELGIDVGDLDRVIQVDAPSTVSSFLQRMGRTGRRTGQTPNTTFLTTEPLAALQAVALVELAKVGWVESVVRPTRAWPVMIHQLVAMSLEKDGVTPDEAWTVLSRVSDFGGIGRGEYDRLVEWLVRDEALVKVSGRLVVGPKVEKHFGRRNFREIYAVFESPQNYVVVTGQQVIGTLEQDFVDLLVQGESAFLLAGRAWWVERVSHDERRVAVVPAPRGKEPNWGGILPRFLGFEVCQAMLAVVRSEGVIPWVSAGAMAAIEEWRIEFGGDGGPKVVDERGGLVGGDDGVRWWTFAGGRINQTLRLVIGALQPSWTVSADNLGVRVRREGGVSLGEVRGLVERLAEPESWEEPQLWDEVAARLPNYRLSKFQVLMPPWVVRELLAGYLLDVAGGCRAAQRMVERSVGGERIAESARTAMLRLVERSDVAPAVSGGHAGVPGAAVRDASRQLVWVADNAGLVRAVDAMVAEERLGLDVETTLRGQTLCLVQIAGRQTTWLIDALMVADLSPLSIVLEEAAIQKLAHNASFERSVLARHGLVLNGVVDTLALSRQKRGKIDGGHSLAAVCQRELGLVLDKSAQLSDWARRPLLPWQRDYAAFGAEVLAAVHDRLTVDSGEAKGFGAVH